jgi:hypothetical protein
MTSTDSITRMRGAIVSLREQTPATIEAALDTLCPIAFSGTKAALDLVENGVLAGIAALLEKPPSDLIYSKAMILLNMLRTFISLQDNNVPKTQHLSILLELCEHRNAAISMQGFIALTEALGANPSTSNTYYATFIRHLPLKLPQITTPTKTDTTIRDMNLLRALSRVMKGFPKGNFKEHIPTLEKLAASSTEEVACFTQGILSRYFEVAGRGFPVIPNTLAEMPLRFFDRSRFAIAGNMATRTAPQGYEFFLIDIPFTSGIVQCGWRIHAVKTHIQFGIAATSAVMPSAPCSFGDPPFAQSGGKYCNHVNFWQGGKCIKGENTGKDGDTVTMEINMTANPRTWHFFVNGVQSSIHMVNIPDSVRFGINLVGQNACCELLGIKQIDRPTSTPRPGGTAVQWV